jgi:molybdate transport system substrate-binding protein
MSPMIQRAARWLTAVTVLAAAGCGPTPAPPVSTPPAAAPGPAPKTAGPQAEMAAAPSSEKELVILCGTSFRSPSEKLVELFKQATGHEAVLSFGGSEDLLPQVRLKAAGDLFITHDPFMDKTKEFGALLRWVRVGYLAPVLVVPKGNPKKIEKIEDLAKPGLQVLLNNPEYSTCGEMVSALLEKKGIKDQVLANVGNAMFKHHSEIGTKLQMGFGDAGIMWNGVAHNFLDAVEIVPGPYEYAQEVRVGVVGLAYTQKKDLVEAFLKFAEENGEKTFAEFGYVK